MTKTRENKYTLIIAVMLCAGWCFLVINPLELDALSPMENHLETSVFVFLFLGFSFMVFHLKYLMLVCMLTSGVLAFVARSKVDLKTKTVEAPKEIQNTQPSNSKTIGHQETESNR